MRHLKLRKDLDDYLSRRAEPRQAPKRSNIFQRFKKHMTIKDNQLDDLDTSVTVIHEKNIFEMTYSKIKKFFKKIS